MQNKRAFSLVEIIIAMGVASLILTGTVVLWHHLAVSARTGLHQQEVHDEARVFMERVTTTLKYARYVGKLPEDDEGEFTYKGIGFNYHHDLENKDAGNQPYQVTLRFVGRSKSIQLQLEEKFWEKDNPRMKGNPVRTDVLLFPKNPENSAFRFDRNEDHNPWEEWVRDNGKFPIALDQINGVKVYTVVLPYRYGKVLNSWDDKQAEKVTMLRASVHPQRK